MRASILPSSPELNRVAQEDRSVHQWYRFVLSYPPHLVRDYLQKFGFDAKHQVLDPFCGTGTTLVESKKLGVPSWGTEANPLAHFACRVKTNWNMPGGTLRKASQAVFERAARELDPFESIEASELPLFSIQRSHVKSKGAGPLRTLPEEQLKLLLANSISPLPLHKTLVLRDIIRATAPVDTQPYLLLALAKSTVFETSNLHFGPEVGVGKPKSDAPVLDCWRSEVECMASDLQLHADNRHVASEVYRADARAMSSLLAPKSIDLVITSPPYPNEKDYTRTTRLESVLLDFLSSKADLRKLKQDMLRSNTRGVYKADDDDQWIRDHVEVQRLADAIEKRRIELGKTSGFERMYHRVTKLYFGGMARHFTELSQLLKPGAMLAYVVGDQASYLRVMIRTGTILADIAASLGYKVEAIDLFRTRLATATKEQLREEVVVLRWPGRKQRRSR